MWSRHSASQTSKQDRRDSPDDQFRSGRSRRHSSPSRSCSCATPASSRSTTRFDLYLDGVPHTGRRFAACCARLRPAARDPPATSGSTLDLPDRDQLPTRPRRDRAGVAAGARFHYSNLAFALLGQVVSRVSADPDEASRARILEPLGLSRTSSARPSRTRRATWSIRSTRPSGARNRSSRVVHPVGQLWSTAGDLCRWASFLATPDDAVLAAKTLRRCTRAGDRRPRSGAAATASGSA